MHLYLTVITCALTPNPAWAWEHLGTVWTDQEMPLEIRVADDGVDGDPDRCEELDRLSACCESGVPGGACIDTTMASFQRWLGSSCVTASANVLDGRINQLVVAPNLGPQLNDEISAITFDDPSGAFLETGTYAAAFGAGRGNEFAYVQDGTAYFTHRTPVDIVFNRHNAFLLNEDLEALADCSHETSFDKVMTHEIGHLLGLAHSCEQSDSCLTPDKRSATMFSTTAPCDTAGTVPTATIGRVSRRSTARSFRCRAHPCSTSASSARLRSPWIARW